MPDKDGPQSGPIGNTDPSKRGYGKRPARESDPNNTRSDPKKRGGKPGYGDVTKK